MNFKQIVETEDPALLTKILMSGNSIESRWAGDNPNCPPKVLAEVLRKGNNDGLSYWITQNPNCPPKAKIDWLEKMGKLTKYNPETFELEHNEKDKDLEELRKLM